MTFTSYVRVDMYLVDVVWVVGDALNNDESKDIILLINWVVVVGEGKKALKAFLPLSQAD